MTWLTKWLGHVLRSEDPQLQANATEDEIRRLEEEQGGRGPQRTDAVGQPLERPGAAGPPRVDDPRL